MLWKLGGWIMTPEQRETIEYYVTKMMRFEHEEATAIRALLADHSRLSEIVERLPKTADGVPVAPGTTLWTVLGGNLEQVQISHGGGLYTECYSTPEAARAAMERE